MATLGGDSLDLRSFFPQVMGGVTAYLDSAATTHKPETVISAMQLAACQNYAPVHRGLYQEAEQASASYEAVRSKCAQLLAFNPEEIIFTRSATESINAVAEKFLLPKLSKGDWVWVSELEHHANYLPWQRACQSSGAELKVLKIDYQTGNIDNDYVSQLRDSRTKMLAITGQSNVLGVIPKLDKLVDAVHSSNGYVLIDAAQCLSHQWTHLATLNADFITFSGHKVFGPTGVGVLAGRFRHLNKMEPWLLGGGMVDWVGEGNSKSEWTDIPARFEAGSPNLIGVIGLGAAIEFIENLPSNYINQKLQVISTYAYESLRKIDNIRVLTPSSAVKNGVLSFVHEHIHPHDLSQVCADQNVAIRAGHHCAQPLMKQLGISSCLRASFSVYNRMSDVDRLVKAIESAEEIFL
jgi:cysteine desulfurase/selenocysteine lyase